MVVVVPWYVVVVVVEGPTKIDECRLVTCFVVPSPVCICFLCLHFVFSDPFLTNDNYSVYSSISQKYTGAAKTEYRMTRYTNDGDLHEAGSLCVALTGPKKLSGDRSATTINVEICCSVLAYVITPFLSASVFW